MAADCDSQAGGACLAGPNGGGSWCAYPASECPSGMRWSDIDTDPLIAGTCVGGDVDAGVDATDAPIDGPPFDGPTVGPVSTGQYASLVIGQSDFTTSAANSDGQSSSSLAGPARVATDGTSLWVADGTNARVLQWSTVPIVNRPVANFVVGQANANTSTSATTQTSLRTGSVGVHASGGRLFVVDGTSNRVLIFNSIPTQNGAPAATVLGQGDFTSSISGKSASGLYSPTDVWSDGTRLIVVDNGNSRVLIWNAIPTANGQAANVVLGRAAFGVGSGDAVPNPPTQTSMAFPTGVYVDGSRLYVADTTNHRVLVWNSIPTTNGAAADFVLGQADFAGNSPNAGGATANEIGLDRPQDMVVASGALFIADSNNNRVVVHFPIPSASADPAEGALGQDNLSSNTTPVTPTGNRMSSPRGLAVTSTRLFVAEYGWNRVLGFTLQ